MTEELMIRWSGQEDLAALTALNNLVWNDRNSPEVTEMTEEQYAKTHPPGNGLVALSGGTVCGYIHLRTPSRMKSHQHVWELAIMTHPDYQSQGTGRKLMEAALREAKNQGKRKLCLRVMSTNEKAIAFYERCGFQVQGRLVEEFYIAGRYVDDILMYKRID